MSISNYPIECQIEAIAMRVLCIRQLKALWRTFNYCDMQSAMFRVYTPDEIHEYGFADLEFRPSLVGDASRAYDDLLKDANRQFGGGVLAISLSIADTFDSMIESKFNEVCDGDADEDDICYMMQTRDHVAYVSNL
jgi:hypothetical protein